jgi:hypothetical protein
MASVQLKPLAGAVGGAAAYGFSQGGTKVFSSEPYQYVALAAAAGSAAFDFLPQVKSTIASATSITDERMLRAVVVGITCAVVAKFHDKVNMMGVAGYSLGAAIGTYVLNM